MMHCIEAESMRVRLACARERSPSARVHALDRAQSGVRGHVNRARRVASLTPTLFVGPARSQPIEQHRNNDKRPHERPLPERADPEQD